MKLIERMANNAREKWLGTPEQVNEYYDNEFNAGYAAGFIACREMARSDAQYNLEQVDLLGELEVEGESTWGYEIPLYNTWITIP